MAFLAFEFQSFTFHIFTFLLIVLFEAGELRQPEKQLAKGGGNIANRLTFSISVRSRSSKQHHIESLAYFKYWPRHEGPKVPELPD